jgi:hypothetical protein
MDLQKEILKLKEAMFVIGERLGVFTNDKERALYKEIEQILNSESIGDVLVSDDEDDEDDTYYID